MFRGWIYPVLCIRTEDIYLAAGLDAVVMLKTIEFGVQLFVPMAVVCLAVCAPPACLPDALRACEVLYTALLEEACGAQFFSGTANELSTKALHVIHSRSAVMARET